MEKSDIKSAVYIRTVPNEAIKHLLMPGEVGAILEWEIRDKNGKLANSGFKKSESFVRQFSFFGFRQPPGSFILLTVSLT